MLSEQKFKKYWDADSSYFTRDNVWQFFKPHLQQPFPGNNKIRATSLHQHPLFGDPALGQGLKLEGLNSDQVEGILQFIGAECLGISEALHTGASGLLANEKVQPLVKGKSYSISGYGPFIAGSESILIRGEIPEVIQIKPVCATCGGSEPDFEKGKTVCFECGGSGQKGADTMCKHCKGTGLVCANCGGSGEIKVTRHYPISWTEYESMEPCPACKPEHCPDCDWDVDEVEGSEDMLVKACKKHECQTCGGSGRVPKCCLHSACSESDQFKPCPACKEVRYHRSGQGMHLDERGEQRREKAGVFYKDSNLVWIGHRDGVLGSLYVIDSRVSDRRKGD